MQAFRNFQITLVSANNLENVRILGEMKVYAKVSLNEEKGTARETNVDTVGGLNPRWNFPVGYTISESAFTGQQQGALQVVVKLYCARTLGDRYLGEVAIPIESLFDSWVRGVREVSYMVSGTRSGSLHISFSFGDHVFYFMEQMDRRQQSAWERALQLGLVVLRHGILFFLNGVVDFGFN